MNKTKETVRTVWHWEGEDRASEKERVVYTKADGTEWVNYLSGKRQIVRENGVAVLHLRPKLVIPRHFHP